MGEVVGAVEIALDFPEPACSASSLSGRRGRRGAVLPEVIDIPLREGSSEERFSVYMGYLKAIFTAQEASSLYMVRVKAIFTV